MTTKARTVIVKVQVPLMTTGEPEALIYDRKRTFTLFSPVTKTIRDAMNGSPKCYFEATYDGTTIDLKRVVDDQPW